MKYLWRRLTKRCTCCGQQLNGHQTINDRIIEINRRAIRLTEELGRIPRAQNCKKCNRLVFEGEPGFVQRYLLVDILDYEPIHSHSTHQEPMRAHV